MKILFVINRFYPAIGGAETHVYLLSKYLVKMGHEVTIYTTDSVSNKDIPSLRLFPPSLSKSEDKKSLPSSETLEGFSINRFSVNLRYWSFNWIPDMFKKLKNNIRDFDIIHAHGYHISTSLIACYYAKKECKPFVLTSHDLIIPESLPAYVKAFKLIYDKTFGKYLLDKSSKLIALTSDHIQQYSERGGNLNKIRVIPNGIELDKYRLTESISYLLNKFHISDEDIILLFVGRIEQYKGIQDIIEIMPNLLANFPHIKFFVVGKNYGYLTELQNLCGKLKLSDSITFTGSLSDEELINLFHRADIFILPSKMEGFGIVFLEAMASSTLCMAYSIPSVRQLIKSKENGILVNNKKEMLDNIIYYLNNLDQKSNIEKNALEYVKNYDISIISKSIEDVYMEVKNENMLSR